MPLSELPESAQSETAPEALPNPQTGKVRPGADVVAEDTVRLRKPHPCGSYDWRVVRTGADIGLRCLGCNHRVNLARAEFERRFKAYLQRANQV